MKQLNVYIILTVLSVMSSCTRIEYNIEKEDGVFTIKASLEGSGTDTKTVLGTPENNLYPVLWSEGDKIKILTSGHLTSDGVGTEMTLKSGAGKKVGVFEGEVPVLPDNCKLYYAVYPYTSYASIGGKELANAIWKDAPAEEVYDNWYNSNFVVLYMPSVQKYAKSSFAKDYNPALAITTDASTDNSELRFKNICGLLQINLTGDITVGKITLTCERNNALWGTCVARYRMRTSYPYEEEFKSVLFNEGEDQAISNTPKNILTLDCGEGVQLSETPTDFYFAVPVNVYSRDNYYDGSQTEIYEGENAFDYGFTIRVYDTEGNEVYTKVTDADNSIVRSKIRKMPVVNISRKGLEDLSANGTANSYIVKPNTTAKFYAEYRGCTTYPIGEAIAKTEILWETQMTSSEVTKGSVLSSASYDSNTGYITLVTGKNEGNAFVAVKDINDQIIWSWHIWVTSYNPDDPNAVDAVDTYNGNILMNRNLGALNKYSDSSKDYGNSGLRYHWGRKDPLENNEEALNYTYFPSAPFSKQKEWLEGDNGDIDMYRRNPTKLYPSGVHKDEYNSKKWNDVKNEYDPCPPGWQVVDFDGLFGIVDFLTNSSDAWRSYMTDKGSYVSLNPFSPSATYPKLPHWTNEHNYMFNSHAYGWEGWQMRADGDLLPVRCQKSNTIKEKTVIDLSANGTANSYIVKPNNNYKFKATVKGNSNETVGAGVRIEPVYFTENKNNFMWNGYSHGHMGGYDDRTVIYDVSYKDGYIYFSTSLDKVYGNAVIGITDVHHRILWSWHIWSVDYDPNIEGGYNEVEWGDGKRKMMKMNLGALSNDTQNSTSLGLMYQWGRKDPFLCAVAHDSNSECGYLGNHGYLTYDSEQATISNSVIYSYKAMMGSENGDWLSKSNNALWGDKKTMFDPCPLGWKVPSRPKWEGEKTFTGSFENYGLTMTNIWYPASGYRHFNSFNLNEVGKQGHYWYSTAKDDGTAYVFYFDDTTIDLANKYDYKAQCNTVRCVKDE